MDCYIQRAYSATMLDRSNHKDSRGILCHWLGERTEHIASHQADILQRPVVQFQQLPDIPAMAERTKDGDDHAQTLTERAEQTMREAEPAGRKEIAGRHDVILRGKASCFRAKTFLAHDPFRQLFCFRDHVERGATIAPTWTVLPFRAFIKRMV